MNNEIEKLLRDFFETAVATADPMKTIPLSLPPKPAGRVVLIGAGKASARMAEAVENVWGPCEGVIVTRYGYTRPTKGVEILEASHPVSDQASVDATKKILNLLESLGKDDFVLSLISGGGSSLLCAPAGDMTLSDKQEVHKVLLKSGAPISKMNIIRKHLSRVKGGQLAAAAYPATMLNFMISDVTGDDPSDIASGPTVAEMSTQTDALNIIKSYEMKLPSSAITYLKQRSSVIKPNDIRLSKVTNKIISAPSQSLKAVTDQAKRAGFLIENLGDHIEGESKTEAFRQVNKAIEKQKEMRSNSPPLLMISGGECTVSGWGGGVGGPNAEFALASAIALNGRKGIHLIACDTDGVDGAAEVAGAIVGPDTLSRALALGINVNEFLRKNDSHHFFELLDSQVITGPTLTNVNDFRAFLIFNERT